MSNSDTRCCAAGIPSVPGWPLDLDSAYTSEHPNFVQIFWRSFALDLIEGYGVPLLQLDKLQRATCFSSEG